MNIEQPFEFKTYLGNEDLVVLVNYNIDDHGVEINSVTAYPSFDLPFLWKDIVDLLSDYWLDQIATRCEDDYRARVEWAVETMERY